MKNVAVRAEGAEKQELENLFELIKRGNIGQVRYLLNTKPELFDKSSSLGDTAMHKAATCGQAEIVKLLLEVKPYLVNVRNIINYTPIIDAAFWGHEKIIRLLLEFNLQLANVIDGCGQTVLHIAARNKKEKTVKIILNFKPELVKVVDFTKQTPLHTASEWGSINAVKLLIAAAPELVNSLDYKGRSPAQLVPEYGNQNIVKILQETQELLKASAESHREEPFEHKGDYEPSEKKLHSSSLNALPPSYMKSLEGQEADVVHPNIDVLPPPSYEENMSPIMHISGANPDLENS